MTMDSDGAGLTAGAGLITDDVYRWAAQTPDAPAMAYGDTAYTWAEWGERVRRVSGALLAHGIGRGDHVAFLDKNHPATMEVTLGAGQIGAANAVVNWRLAGAELIHVLSDSAPRIVFVGGEFAPTLEKLRADLR